jgi:hypothetical protein
VTSTGATGTGKFVFDSAPTISGHPTIEGVTSTGATGTAKFVFSASPTFTGTVTAPNLTLTGLSATSGTSYTVCIKTNVLYTSQSGTACTNTSDARLKRFVESLENDNGLDSIMKLRPVRFRWRDVADDKENGEQYGLIAQEVEAVFPAHGITFTSGDSTLDLGNGKTETVKKIHGVNYDRLTVPLIKAVQELKILFDGVEARIVALSARVDHHDADIAALKAANDNLKAANDNEKAELKALRDEFRAYKAAHP